MLTVKHIHLNGDENIALVWSARYSPGCGSEGQRAMMESESPLPATVWVRLAADHEERPLTGGTIFVMNDQGSTVARYDLGLSPVPLRGSIPRAA